jgi:hypothetical protein
MKMSNEQMWEGIQALSCVKETGKLGYACARNLRRLMDACKEYIEVRDRLMMEYGKDEGGGKFTFEPDKAKAFSEAIREYSIIEHEVDVFQVSEDVFCGGGLTTREMYTLDWMVKEEA